MLPWDVLVLSTYAFVSALYTYTLLKPDIIAKGISLPFFGIVMKREVSDAELARIREQSEKNARRLAPIALPLAILIHTVTAWVLATQLARTWWFGGVLAPTFIAAALATGPAVVILASLVAYGYKENMKDTYALLAKVSAIASVIMMFIYYNDFVVRFWWNTGKEFEAVRLVFTKYLAVHAVEVVFIILSAIIFITRARERNWLIGGSLSVIVGVFAHRFLLVPPAYNLIPLRMPVIMHGETHEWSYPIAVGQVKGTLLGPEPVFASYWSYVPSIVEITITVGFAAIIVLAFLSLIKILPIAEAKR
jgi:molybdopterin-containing oxidoreductase family membrane subunit